MTKKTKVLPPVERYLVGHAGNVIVDVCGRAGREIASLDDLCHKANLYTPLLEALKAIASIPCFACAHEANDFEGCACQSCIARCAIMKAEGR